MRAKPKPVPNTPAPASVGPKIHPPFPVGHTRLIITWIGILASLGMGAGVALVVIGYHGDLLLMCGPSAITGLFGMLVNRPAPPVDTVPKP